MKFDYMDFFEERKLEERLTKLKKSNNIEQSFLKKIESIGELYDDDLKKRELIVFKLFIEYPDMHTQLIDFFVKNEILPMKMLMQAVINSGLVLGSQKNNEKNKLIKKGYILEYEEVLKKYDELLKKWINCSKELGFSESIDLSNFFTYLLWNGYFNEEKDHKYQHEGRIHLNNLYSLTIMQGNGVCLNYSYALRDFLIQAGYNSSVIHNYANSIKNIQNHLQVNRQVVPFKLYTKFLQKALSKVAQKMGNHACTLIEEKGNLYIYDPTNLLTWNVISHDKAQAVNGDGVLDLKYYISYISATKKSETIALDKLATYNYPGPVFDQETLKLKSEECREVLLSNQSLIDDCYQETKENIAFINQSVKKLKKRK